MELEEPALVAVPRLPVLLAPGELDTPASGAGGPGGLDGDAAGDPAAFVTPGMPHFDTGLTAGGVAAGGGTVPGKRDILESNYANDVVKPKLATTTWEWLPQANRSQTDNCKPR